MSYDPFTNSGGYYSVPNINTIDSIYDSLLTWPLQGPTGYSTASNPPYSFEGATGCGIRHGQTGTYDKIIFSGNSTDVMSVSQLGTVINGALTVNTEDRNYRFSNNGTLRPQGLQFTDNGSYGYLGIETTSALPDARINFNVMNTNNQIIATAMLDGNSTSATQNRTAGSEQGNLIFYTRTGGLLRECLRMTPNTSTTVQNQLPDGTASVPSLSYVQDTDTGIYRPSENVLSIVTNGTARFNCATGANESYLPLRGPTGSVSTPTYSFLSDTSAGMYSQSANAVGFCASGVSLASFSPTGSNVTSDLTAPRFVCSSSGSTGSPSLALDTSMGFYKSATDTIGLCTNAVERITVSTNTIDTTLPIRITGNNYLSIGGSDITYRSTNAGASTNQVTQFTGNSSYAYLGFDCSSTATDARLNFNTLNSSFNIIKCANITGNLSTTRTAGVETGNLVFSVKPSGAAVTEAFRIASNGSTSVQTLFTDGATGVPSISFKNDAGMGIYRSGSNTLGVCTNSVERLILNTSTLDSTLPIRVTGSNYLTVATSDVGYRLTNGGTVINQVFQAGGNGGFGYFGIDHSVTDPYSGLNFNLMNTNSQIILTAGIFGNYSTATVSRTAGSETGNLLFAIRSSDGVFRECVRMVSNGASAVQTQYVDGTVTIPSISFKNNTDLGLYRSAADTLGLVTAGVGRIVINTANITANLPITSPTGSASAPSYSFNGDTNTGIFSPSADTLNFTTGGSTRMSINTSTIGFGSNLRIPDGSATVPSISFDADTNTGIYRVGNDVLGIAAGGQSYSFGNGYFFQSDDVQSNLGLGTHRWIAVYAQNGTIQTSDQNEKKDIENSPLGLDFVNKLTPRRYRWVDGKSGRFHYGLVAQELKTVLDDSNIDSKDFAAYVDSSVTETPDKPSKLGINYSEIMTVLIQSVKDLSKKLDSALERIAVLEAN